MTLCVCFGSHHNTAVLGLEPAQTHRVAQWGYHQDGEVTNLSRCPVVAIRMTYDNVSILSPPRRGVALIMLEPIPSAANIAAFAVAIFACMHVCRIPPYVVCHTARPELSHAFVHMSHKVGSLASVAGLAGTPVGWSGGCNVCTDASKSRAWGGDVCM